MSRRPTPGPPLAIHIAVVMCTPSDKQCNLPGGLNPRECADTTTGLQLALVSTAG